MSRMIIVPGLTGLLLLSGCSVDLGESIGVGAEPPKPIGMIVGDEPYAVRAGASALAEGGSAADAAAATYFALAVTYPIAAALGGGGSCIVHSPDDNKTDEIDFPAANPAGGGAFAVPGNVRGFAMLQKTYGVLSWQRVLVAAERLAAAGFPISHALSSRLQAAQDVVRLDASLAAEFMDESGQLKAEGSIVESPALADTLSQIRTRGADTFYQSDLAQRLISYSSSQGGSIAASDISSYRPVEAEPRSVQMNGLTVFVPSGAHHAGAFAGALFERLESMGATAGGGQDEVTMSLAARQVLGGAPGPANDFGSTGFAARDAKGEVVACAVTMGSPFGAGRTVSGTGILLARAPSASDMGTAAAFLSPAIIVNSGGAAFAGAGAGGPGATEAIATAVLRVSRGTVLDSPAALRTREALRSDTINAIVCQQGRCLALPDPAGTGLGQSADVSP